MKEREPLLFRNSQSSRADTYTYFQSNMINSVIEIRLDYCRNIAWKRLEGHLSLDLKVEEKGIPGSRSICKLRSLRTSLLRRYENFPAVVV